MADILVDSTLFEDFRSGDSGARDVIDTILDGEGTAPISPLTGTGRASGGERRKDPVGAG